jgi:hypothetical protein
MPGQRANIPKIYLYKFLSDFLVLVPVIVPFYKSCGLSVTTMVGRLFAVICFPIFGQIVDRASLSTAFVVLGIAVCVCGAPVTWALRAHSMTGTSSWHTPSSITRK